MSSIFPVIMAGGSGSRLWPLSRKNFPKQFLPLYSNESMLQDTVARLKGLTDTPPALICGEDHRFSVAEQLRGAKVDNSGIILEPVGRNTAPAIALAALQATAQGDDPLLLILAADHVIRDVDAFQQAVKKAVPMAEAGKLVTFGIVATGPETGYGYIKRGSELDAGFGVERFVEKPDLETAQQYLDSGDYYWNSGLFLIRASDYLAELKMHRPDILQACEQSMAAAAVDSDFIRVDKIAFTACPDDSVDYAVMEKTARAAVVPMDCGWSDLGSWSALWEVADKDENGNALQGDVVAIDCKNTLVKTDNKLIATVGVEDLIVVDSDDALLVAHRDQVQKVKNVVEHLKGESRSEAVNHRKVFRPWGYYDSIDFGERFQVKRIVVNPGSQLSLQMHHHRAEHWIVVSGTATVTRGEESFFVSENESTYIPLGVKHRLENPGAIPLEMIEVQSGSYLGEDDIVRFEDVYGRN